MWKRVSWDDFLLEARWVELLTCLVLLGSEDTCEIGRHCCTFVCREIIEMLIARC